MIALLLVIIVILLGYIAFTVALSARDADELRRAEKLRKDAIAKEVISLFESRPNDPKT